MLSETARPAPAVVIRVAAVFARDGLTGVYIDLKRVSGKERDKICALKGSFKTPSPAF